MIKNQYRSRDVLIKQQEKKLRKMVEFCYNNIKYYNRLFKQYNLNPDDIRKITDLEKLPVMTKETIKKNQSELLNPNINRMRFYKANTGGTSGNPLIYFLSKNDRLYGGLIIYRAWMRASYRLGDPLAVLGGASIVPSTKSSIMRNLNERMRNMKFMSSFNLGELEMKYYYDTLKKFKPKFLRGYPSAIHHFSRFLESESLSLNLKAIITTSEMLYPKIRYEIEDNLNAKVYDGYGAGDGGVSASECHLGSYHIDTERSILEIINDDHMKIVHKTGKIVSTNLENFAMPLIRYELGDMGIQSDRYCECGRGSPIIDKLTGRTVSIFWTPNDHAIHGWFFLYIFWEHGSGIKQYQVVQTRKDRIEILIIPESDFDPNKLNIIRNLIHNKCPEWKVKFKLVKNIPKPSSGKIEFIISKVNSQY